MYKHADKSMFKNGIPICKVDEYVYLCKPNNRIIMKLRKGFALREIGTDHVVVPEGIEVIDFNKLISLNGSAKYLWEALQDKDFTVDEVAALLTAKYEVADEIAKADAAKLVAKWQEIGLIEA